MISILHFSNTQARGGVEEHILSLVRRLDRRQFKLHLVCSPIVAAQVQKDVPGDVELISLNLSKPTQLKEGFRFARLLREKRIDILHSHMFQSSLFASPVGFLCHVPVVIETPHIREMWRHGWIKGRFFVDRLVGLTVKHYIAVSAANADYLVRKKGLPSNKITVIYPGTDLTRFEADQPTSHYLKKTLGFADLDPVLIVLGRLESQKGHRVLLDAMPTILRQFPKVRLICLSEGSLREELERHVRELGLANSVRFVGYQPDVRGWLASADISVLPSFYEGLPLAAIESMAAGLPVVASAVDGTPEVVLDGTTGLTVPPGNPAALAAAICRLLESTELRSRMGTAGRQRATTSFSEECLLQRTEALYLRAWEHYRSQNGRKRTEATPSQLPTGIVSGKCN
jgi:glycosyltransferase involved in cell wall biosynthesis